MKQDRIASVAFFLFAAVYLAMAFFTIGEPASRQVLGPDVFPKAIGALMLFLAAVYVMQSFRGLVHEDEQRAAIIGADDKLNSYMDRKTVGILLVLMLAYAFDPQPDWRHPRFSERALYGISLAVLAGGVAQLAIQWPALWRQGFRFRWRLDFADPGLRQVWRRSWPYMGQGPSSSDTFLSGGRGGGGVLSVAGGCSPSSLIT